MDSPGNGMARWTHRGGGRAGELVEPAASPGSRNGLPAVKPIGGAEHLLPLPGRADSAYSSFSGGSSFPECPTPPGCSESRCSPPEQAPYMDSEYVRGIYNPGAANPELGCPRLHEAPELRIRSVASAPTRRTLGQGPRVAPPPSPPPRLDSRSIAGRLERSQGRRSPAGARAADRAVPWSRHGVEATEQDPRVLRGEALGSKGLSPDAPSEVPAAKPRRGKANGEQSPAQQALRRSNPHVFSRPSSFIFQEYLRSDSVATAPRRLSVCSSAHTCPVPGRTSPRGCHPVHTSPKAAGDAQEANGSHCGMNKPAPGAADLRDLGSSSSEPRGSLPCAPCSPRARFCSDGDQEVFEDCCDLKYTGTTLPVKNTSRGLNGCLEVNQGCGSEGRTGSDVRGPLPSPPGRTQGPSASCSRGPGLCPAESSRAPSFSPRAGAVSLVSRENQADDSSPDPSKCLGQEEPPVPHQSELQSQLSRQLRGEQITRQTTPMLYYLSAGKPTLHHSKLPQHQEDPRSSPEVPTSSCSAPVRCLEAQRADGQPPWSSRQPRCGADVPEDLLSRSPASSTEESFKNDYREKLKVAQKKVLRETSFKRKDLQMSLPVRLRQKPSKRPTTEHLRSFSLTAAAGDAKPLPLSPSRLESLGSFSGEEEEKRPPTGRAGGRSRRVTKEQKQLCYSEPEKLNQLAEKESWSRVRGGTSEQDVVAARRKALESRGRALSSSSSISRTELKQIQHTALVQYMERKVGQRPCGSQHLPLSHPKQPPGNVPGAGGSRQVQSTEGFCHVSSKEKPPELFPPLAFVPPLRVTTSRWDPSSAGAAASRCHPSPSAEGGSCSIKSVSAESLPQAGDPALGRVRQRSKSTPAATQDSDGGVGGAAAPSQRCESCLDTPSFRGPEKDGPETLGCKDRDVPGCLRRQGSQELTPEPSPRRGSKEDPQLEEGEEDRAKSPKDGAVVEHPEQQAAAPPRDTDPARGLVVKETPVPSSQEEDALPARETHLPERTLRSPEDQRYEELAMEIVAKDSSLVAVLEPHPVRKTALELMEGLFPVSVTARERARRRKGDVVGLTRGDDSKSSRAAAECPPADRGAKQRREGPTSMRNQVLNRSRESSSDLDDITPKKLELISSLRSKLQALWEERELVLSEARECAERGEELQAVVRGVCKPNEFERYLMFVGDLEKVVSLLLCLSSRLARVQSAMRRIGSSADAEEVQSLAERHNLLSRQREDAKDLKENLDRREGVVSGILAKYLTEQQLQDYRRFVQVKTSLLIEQKDLEEQIRFLEEQLENLEQSLPL